MLILIRGEVSPLILATKRVLKINRDKEMGKIGGKNFVSQTIISLVRLYQRTAPKRLRAACRFQPSCSEYMILAVQKYGSMKGFFMGMWRTMRCRRPNGGEDYP